MKLENFENKPSAFKKFFSSMTRTQKLLLLVILPIGAFSVLPIIFILLIGILPTITIMITDPNNTNKLTIIGCFNMSGVTMYVFNIINHFGFDGVNDLSSNIFHLIIMLGSAGVGLLLYKELPTLFVFMAKASLQKQLRNIDDKLQKISETWGSEIIAHDSSNGKGKEASKSI